MHYNLYNFINIKLHNIFGIKFNNFFRLRQNTFKNYLMQIIISRLINTSILLPLNFFFFIT